MNLTEWITKEDLSIKEFAEEFVNVVKENFGEHNYKCVTDIVNKHLANGADTRTEPALPIQNVVCCPLCHNTKLTARVDDTFSCDKCGVVFLGQHTTDSGMKSADKFARTMIKSTNVKKEKKRGIFFIK